MDLADALTRWTALLALLCAVLAAAGKAGPFDVGDGVLRWLWTVGCLLFLAHVGCAFRFQHHWSHEAAYEATARRTAETVGVASGAGLYLNYLFAVLWPADVIWWWLAPLARSARPRWLTWCWIAFFGFMALNATVVFGGTTARLLGAACCVFLTLLLLARLLRRSS
jgi:hypothetical protein